MTAALLPLLFGLIGCGVFGLRRKIGRVAYKIGFPPFVAPTEEEKVRLFGMIGVVFALISFGTTGLMLLPTP